jgi:hypothetical protein
VLHCGMKKLGPLALCRTRAVVPQVIR